MRRRRRGRLRGKMRSRRQQRELLQLAAACHPLARRRDATRRAQRQRARGEHEKDALHAQRLEEQQGMLQRLSATVSSLKQHLGSGAGRDGAASGASSLWSESERKGGAASARGGFDHAGLLRHFEHVQAKHAAARHEALLSRSLQGHPTGAQANGPPRPPAKANE